MLGKLAVALAPPEPQLQHAALRLTARGWETAPLPAPEGSGAVVAALDLRAHEAVVEHSGGGERRIALGPDRPVGEVTADVLGAVRDLAGPVEIDSTPQEVSWAVPLDEDREHATYDREAVDVYFQAATRAALVLAAFRAPYRGRSTPVNADAPDVVVELVEVEDRGFNPLGVKGVGEIGQVGVAAAIANAVFHATGYRARELPIAIEHLLGATSRDPSPARA